MSGATPYLWARRLGYGFGGIALGYTMYMLYMIRQLKRMGEEFERDVGLPRTPRTMAEFREAYASAKREYAAQMAAGSGTAPESKEK